MRVGVLRDVEILLQLAAGVREKRPVRADARTEFICLEQVVSRDGDETAIADLHLVVELQKPFVLAPVLGTKTAARKHQHQRIAALQLREIAVLAPLIRKLVVRKDRARNDVGSHRRAPSMWSVASCAACSAVPPRMRLIM